jgi:hypothetical protein
MAAGTGTGGRTGGDQSGIITSSCDEHQRTNGDIAVSIGRGGIGLRMRRGSRAAAGMRTSRSGSRNRPGSNPTARAHRSRYLTTPRTIDLSRQQHLDARSKGRVRAAKANLRSAPSRRLLAFSNAAPRRSWGTCSGQCEEGVFYDGVIPGNCMDSAGSSHTCAGAGGGRECRDGRRDIKVWLVGLRSPNTG